MCNKCKQSKDEIEFEYIYFKREYKHLCKDCDDYKRPLEITNSKLNKIDDPSADPEVPDIRA